MEYKDLIYFLQHIGTDPSRLIFEDELTGIYNRRFLLNYFRHKVVWDSLEGQPLSLLMMDLDQFKEINDTYGHEAGDQVLIWIASLIKEISGDEGLAVRYAGDEFIVLLPNADKGVALETADRLLHRLHREFVRLAEMDEELSVTVSIGVACAPDDAYTGKALIQKADTALYYAKKTGRNRLADAGQIAAEDVFAKTALYQLDKARIAGRKSQLSKVAEALRKFSRRKSQFLIVDGASGMGKSEFLQTIRRNLAQSKIMQIAVNGVPQEGFRPYYLTTTILVEIMNQRPDKGAQILDDLSPQEVNSLAHVLPQLGEPAECSDHEDAKIQRELIFSTLVHFIPHLISFRPLILFVDDMHLSDEATLLLLRQLLLRGEVPLFLCATATDIRPGKREGPQSPLERFYIAFHEELSLETLPLTPLTASDIGSHFRGIFPRVSLPESLEDTLAQLTQGNPLFLSEIQRKLVLDAKISLTGQQWVVQPLEEGYLPKSLEEIVSQKIATLDEESQQLLDQASTFGENVSLSVLTGSSENKETKILEFVDQAVAQGLISTDYQMNDDTIRFLGKRVLEITYGAIDEERKKELHEQIGDYQETLHEQRLLPSAATLAYHFQLSANQEKAQLYLESQQTYNNKIFNVQEAVDYTGEKPEDNVQEDTSLDPASLGEIPGVIRALLTTVRNIKLYPPGSNAIVSSTQQLKESIDRILANNARLNLTISENDLMINGETLDTGDFKSIAEAFEKFFSRVELKSIAFSQGLGEDELKAMLEGLSRVSKKMIEPRFWKRFAAEQRLLNIELKQVQYTTVSKPDVLGREDTGTTHYVTATDDTSQLLSSEHRVNEQDLSQIPQILRVLLTATSNIKLYPPESTAITHAIEQVHRALKTFLGKRPALTFARIGQSLLINGHSIDTSDFKTIAAGFLRFLESVKLKSVSFLRDISVRELAAFISAVGQGSHEGFDRAFWQRLSRDQRLSSILFDQRLYGILQERVGPSVTPVETAATSAKADDLELEGIVSKPSAPKEFSFSREPSTTESIPESVSTEPRQVHISDDLLDSMAGSLGDLLLRGDEGQSRLIINQIFHNFLDQTSRIRLGVINLCENFLQDPVYGSQSKVVTLFADPLLSVFFKEENPNLLRKMSALLGRTASNLLQFGDYRLATRIFTHLRDRQEVSRAGTDSSTRPEIIFLHDLEPRTQLVLLEDLRSQDPARLQKVTQLLSSLGSAAIPLLIEVIKGENNLRVRQIASYLLRELGSEAAAILKRELVLEGFSQERVRILEVIDGVTHDLETELAYALGDENPKVRRAAFHLAERLNDTRVTSLLFDYASHEDLQIAVFAIKSLAKLRPAGAVDILLSQLESSKEIARLLACCRALGQIADPAAIEPLAKIMAPGSFLSLRKKRSSSVRAAAAFALAQIPDPRVVEILAPYADDRDPKVRQIARSLVGG